jgi:hypothetical protein
MTNTTHTQGPLIASQDGAQWMIGAPVSDTLPAHAARHIGNAYNEANARLIAAAPDLLAALENLMAGACEALSFLDRETVRHLKPLIDSAETAVLKAKGN